jgi:hypothetical protein
MPLLDPSSAFCRTDLSLPFFASLLRVLGMLDRSAVIFVVSVWNGASYYVEVFGRRFEKDLLELRREMELIKSAEQAVSAGTGADTDKERDDVSESEAAAAATSLPGADATTDSKKDK